MFKIRCLKVQVANIKFTIRFLLKIKNSNQILYYNFKIYSAICRSSRQTHIISFVNLSSFLRQLFCISIATVLHSVASLTLYSFPLTKANSNFIEFLQLQWNFAATIQNSNPVKITASNEICVVYVITFAGPARNTFVNRSLLYISIEIAFDSCIVEQKPM